MGVNIVLHRALTADFLALSSDSDSLLQRLTPCDRAALSQLTAAFNEVRPIAFLIGAGRARSRQVVDCFLATADKQTSVVRITGPCTDATSCMREVIRSIGFEPKDFGLTDLENIFKMFLAFQKDQGSRTVICIEETQDCSSWVLDKVFALAKQEMAETFGLFIILSGRRKLARVLNQHSPHAEAVLTGRHIRIAPLTLSETREFVIQQAKSESFDDASQIIELDQGKLYAYKGNYSYYLEKKEERLAIEQTTLGKAKNLFKKELDWMRRQPKARTTKSKSRIEDFYQIKKKHTSVEMIIKYS